MTCLWALDDAWPQAVQYKSWSQWIRWARLPSRSRTHRQYGLRTPTIGQRVSRVGRRTRRSRAPLISSSLMRVFNIFITQIPFFALFAIDTSHHIDTRAVTLCHCLLLYAS
ncbi:hypothetical protein L210DRAFT_451912 [Boletus edulis BED1]|uniref:Uncharacterized protein n=1 Tax=Boletus edulis BED1 TaxID=1328754 RepID=A0AAD4BUW2_BOLED|nr:hypothetical protein L210DRAFT_451912 [Boletus edulis BED1]